MRKKLSYSFQNSDALYRDLGCHKDVWEKSEIWNNDPDSVPSTRAEDDGERVIELNAMDAIESIASNYISAEGGRRELRAGIHLDFAFPETVALQTETDLKGRQTNFREERESLGSKLRSAERKLRRIRVRYDITREPSYARYPIVVWGVAAAFVLGETYVNGALLAEVVEGGLIGGWSLAALISFVNVLIGGVSGLYLPRLWGTEIAPPWRRRLAVLLGSIAILAVLIVNLAVSYVRAYGIADLSTGISAFWLGSLLPQNLEALGLFMIGVGVSIVAALKFSTLHDPIPEYERAHRDLQEILASVDALDTAAPSQLQMGAEDGHARLDHSLASVRAAVTQYKSSIDESEHAARALGGDIKRIRHVHEKCMEKRRGDLKKLCDTHPSYWDAASATIEVASPVFDGLPAEHETVAKAEERLDELEVKVTSAHARIERALQEARDGIELSATPRDREETGASSRVVKMRFKREA
ncbi:MAG: hypothetical protein AAF830_17015 [Pseudomonadota bacterium]